MFNSVAKITTVQVPSTLAVSKDWKLWLINMNNAFLHGELDGKIYMIQLKEFKNAVGVMNQYMQSPEKPHLNVARQIL